MPQVARIDPSSREWRVGEGGNADRPPAERHWCSGDFFQFVQARQVFAEKGFAALGFFYGLSSPQRNVRLNNVDGSTEVGNSLNSTRIAELRGIRIRMNSSVCVARLGPVPAAQPQKLQLKRPQRGQINTVLAPANFQIFVEPFPSWPISASREDQPGTGLHASARHNKNSLERNRRLNRRFAIRHVGVRNRMEYRPSCPQRCLFSQSDRLIQGVEGGGELAA